MKNLPKVDLHVHLEGTITPETVMRIARRNKVSVPPDLIEGGRFNWKGDGTPAGELNAFLASYDAATSVMKCAADYTDITYDFLKRSAAEGCIYAEITISADHGAMAGLTYPEMLDAITKGYEQAKKETGIEARFISSCVRHFGPEDALKVGKITRDHPHPLVTAFGMAGDENSYSVADFKPAFDISGLSRRTAHAGEAAGPSSVHDASSILKARRFGHMVRAIESPALMKELKAINAVPEVCVSSNMALKVFKDYTSHPLRKFFDAGLKVTLGSDDPTFFNTSIGREYQIAKDHFGFTDRELLQISKNALEEAFVDDATRARLLAKLNADPLLKQVSPAEKKP
jgi:adenosine deaminase